MAAHIDKAESLGQHYRDPSHRRARMNIYHFLAARTRAAFRWRFDHLRLPPTSRLLEL